MRRALATGIVALLPPGASASPSPSIGLGVWPARTVIRGGTPQVVHVRNGGVAPIAVDLAPAGFALDPRGSPRIVAGPGAGRWLTVRPALLRVPPGVTQTFTVWPAVPPGARPGDHPALVVLRTRPPGGRLIGVRVRIGVIVDVRVAGKVRRRVALRSLRVQPRGRRREFLLAVANLGDLTETAGPLASLELWTQRRLLTRLRARPRELLPHSSGLVTFTYSGRRRGAVRAVAVFRLRGGGGTTARRAFEIRL
jgi:hypothetical protein